MVNATDNKKRLILIFALNITRRLQNWSEAGTSKENMAPKT